MVVLAAVAAMVVAACNGPHTPHVASLPASAASATQPAGHEATQSSAGDPTRLVDQWAACERRHGDPEQSDPTIDAYGVINIVTPQVGIISGGSEQVTGTCSSYLARAQNELRAANPVAAAPNQVELIKYVNCMRANGVPNYPYPNGDKTSFIGTGVDPQSPEVEGVNDECGNKLHLPAWWVNGIGPPGDISVTGGAGPHAPATPPPCAFEKGETCTQTIVPGSGGTGPGQVNGG
jgi:hypothetical protein